MVGHIPLEDIILVRVQVSQLCTETSQRLYYLGSSPNYPAVARVSQ